ncbi:ricin-type beta-trefoil lectin domain protein [Flexivirga meconopsidis]|uniref:ricin-type beta-trefoil lectin domain protein n=1 Tax=Flexivirga meconopsidis TaxID=2977121 RepID=UPI00223F17A0|nr:ricin-type beta-trefoil lectin domain protein [Flexivirga meconopsidis]
MRTFVDRLRAPVLACLALLIAIAPAMAVSPARATGMPAHGDTGTADPKEHAKKDLAGVPMSQIEKQANPAAARADQSSVQRARAAMPAQLGGSWAAPVATQVVPVFTALLPNGKLLMWDSVGDGAAEGYPDQTFTRVEVYDPATGAQQRVDLNGSNIFCAGFVQLSDGTVLVAGGNKDQQLNGTNLTHVFDWNTMSWRRGPNMSGERWYPSVAALMDDDAIIVGGGPSTVDIRQADGTLRTLGFQRPTSRLYPFIQSQPDGRVLSAGPEPTMLRYTWQGGGSVAQLANRDGLTRDYAGYAQYRPGLTMVAGGGNPVASTALIDTRGATPKVTAGAPMSTPRRQHNLTILPDGSLLATGGQTTWGTGGLVDLSHPALSPERWDPDTNTWTSYEPAAIKRFYHSTALLLPDGRIFTGGGGVCDACVKTGYLAKNLEIFTPPYLYKKDGTGLAPRPVLTGTPAEVKIDSAFTVTSPQAADIAKIGMIRLGAPTHSEDQGQRYIPLKYSVSGTSITVRTPPNTAQAPGGYYMLFAVDKNGVPNVAPIVKVVRPTAGTARVETARSGGTPVMAYADSAFSTQPQAMEAGVWDAADGGLSGVGGAGQLSGIDVANGWQVKLCSGANLTGSCQVYGAGVRSVSSFDNRTASLQITATDADPGGPDPIIATPQGTNQVVSARDPSTCLTASSLASGAPVSSRTCANTSREQVWQYTNGVVSPSANLRLCLDVDQSGTANGSKVQVWGCNGTAAQAWTIQPDRSLRNPQSGKCLDWPGGQPAGTQLVIWTCGSTSNQQWNWRSAALPAMPPAKQYISAANGQCLTSSLVTAGCDANAAEQRWEISGGALKLPGSDTCLQVNKSRYWLWTNYSLVTASCTGSDAQRFSYDASQRLASSVDGRCITVSGQMVGVSVCNTSAAQRWSTRSVGLFHRAAVDNTSGT